jgi:hypothetical protein
MTLKQYNKIRLMPAVRTVYACIAIRVVGFG